MKIKYSIEFIVHYTDIPSTSKIRYVGTAAGGVSLDYQVANLRIK